MKWLFGCYSLWIKHTHSLYKWNIIQLCLESAAVDTSSHSQKFWCKLWVLLLHCSTQGGDADLQKPRPCACVMALPITLLYSVLVWAGEDEQGKCLRLSSRALPLRSCSWATAIQKAQPGQQSEHCPAEWPEGIEQSGWGCVKHLPQQTAPSALLPDSEPHEAGQRCPAGFFQVNRADTHTHSCQGGERQKEQRWAFRNFSPGLESWHPVNTGLCFELHLWAPLLVMPAPIFLTRTNKPYGLAWEFHMLLDLPYGILNSTYTSDFNNPLFLKRKGQIISLPCNNRCFTSMKNHSVVLAAPKLSCLTPAILDERELNMGNSAVEQLSPCLYSWG